MSLDVQQEQDSIPKVGMNLELSKDNEPDLVVYTDGSKDENRVGSGWLITAGDAVLDEDSISLPKHSSVFQAEVMAISEATQRLNKEEKFRGKKVMIRSDSQAAIMAISKITVNSQLVKNAIKRLQTLTKSTVVATEWVKGHDNCTGNEVADALTKSRAQGMDNKRK